MAGISDALTPDMTVLRVDFPAHGESGFPPQPWGVPDFAANLLELLMKLDFLPCSVIAHSFGGRVTIELAADHPERFEKLILTGAAGIRPKLSSEKSKKSQRYQRLKKLVGVAETDAQSSESASPAPDMRNACRLPAPPDRCRQSPFPSAAPSTAAFPCRGRPR